MRLSRAEMRRRARAGELVDAGATPAHSRQPTQLHRELLVPVEYCAAPEESYNTPESKKRPKRDRFLASFLAMADEEQRGRNERDEEPHEHRRYHGDAEPGAEESRKLHIAHSESSRVREDDEKQH